MFALALFSRKGNVMKKRITVYIFLLTLLVGVFGSVSVYASEINFEQCKFYSIATQSVLSYEVDEDVCSGQVIGNLNITDISTENFGVVGIRDGKYNSLNYLIFSSESFDVSLTRTHFYYDFNYDKFSSWSGSLGMEQWVEGSDDWYCTKTYELSSTKVDNIYYVSLGSHQAFSSSELETVSCVGSGYVFDITAEEYDSITNKYKLAYYLSNNILGNYGDDLTQAPNVSVDEYVEPKEPVYNAELGHLQNIRRQARFLGSSSGTNQDYQFEFSYGLTTSTGFDLRTEGADVEYLVKIKGGYETLFGNYYSLPTVKTDSFYAGNGVDSFVIYSETFNNLVQSFRTDDVPITASLEYTEYVYARPILKDGADTYYGLWSRIYSEDGSYRVDYGTTPDGMVSTEGDTENEEFESVGSDDVDNSLGSGSDWEDAESNSRPDNNNSLTDDELIEQAGSLIEQIGEIPQFISELFSFLPSWCLTLFGVGFGLIVFLIIYKLVRG